MAFYTYENGCMMVTTEIRYGFKRFKAKNAQYRHTVDNDLMLEEWDFVSYAYPCMSVNHVLDTDSWEVLITRDALNCSRTTARQIGDFLRYIGCPITLHDIRDAMSFDDDFSSNFETWINDECSISLMDSVAYRF